MSTSRRQGAYSARLSAALEAKDRHHPDHLANGDEQKYANCHYPVSFTKGLDHDAASGLLKDPDDFRAFRTAVDEGYIDAFTNRVFVPPHANGRRQWEAPTAGTAYDLQGPDCQAVTMAPAPALCSDELDFEMAEVYELALLRDVKLSEFEESGGNGISDAVTRMNNLDYAKDGFPVRPRVVGGNGKLTKQTAFRGSSPGVEVGPYLSQFMMIGNRDLDRDGDVGAGNIAYGALNISQKVPVAEAGLDYMMAWDEWVDVQNGCDVNAGTGEPGQKFTPGERRFICTPRDLATYVHYDALYEAYLNACLIMLGMGTPFDASFSHLSGGRNNFPSAGKRITNAGGFALYGGPHILTLVTEVATRALKAARFQKFNTHIRARPEVLAARIDGVDPQGPDRTNIEEAHPQLCGAFTKMRGNIHETVHAVHGHNQSKGFDTVLLPMAFREGSPMHPSYAAGHATVAGACVTVLKAFFDTGAHLVERTQGGNSKIGFFGAKPSDATDRFVQFKTNSDCDGLDCIEVECPLTLEGELNKLAANISIARNMAGVHYFSDYYDSLRMGEEIAIGLLEEQALCYATDPFVMSVQTFEGDTVRIGAR